MGAVAHDQPFGWLLAMALTAVLDELHERLDRAGWLRIRPMWGFVLRSLRAQPRTIGEVGELLGITKQTAAKVVAALIEERLVERREHPSDRTAAALWLTDHGRRFRTDAETAYEATEAGWAKVAGRDDLDAIRRAIPRRTRHQVRPHPTTPPASPLKAVS